MSADQLARIRAAVLARPHLDHEDFARAVQIFGWPSDAARGCLLGLVRVAWGEPKAYVDPEAYTTPEGAFACAVWGSHDQCLGRGGDEEDALIAALEASPLEAP